MIEIIFLTSNNVKLAHAQHLCRDYNIFISKQKHYGISYKEPRIFDRDQLLRASINDAYQRLSKYLNKLDEKFFFIEDTSVVINALSQEKEFPGVDIKYWMRENNFESVDRLLKANGNDRSVEVRSDIVLMLPRSLRKLLGLNEKFKKFTNSVKGRITDKEVKFITQPLYSWLDDKTFNKWFIPDGCETVMSLLPIEKADNYDFRSGTFQQMLVFLEELNLIRKKTLTDKKLKEEVRSQLSQRNLFSPPPIFIVCGFTCAGKTTLAEYITNNYNYYHLEASDYMYLSYFRTHGVGTLVKVADFAEKALEKYPTIVVDQIINDIDELGNVPVIITGFRSPEEIEGFKRQYKGDSQIEIIFVETSPDIRFQRCVDRSRFDKHKNRVDFDKNDEQQIRMGLRKIKTQLINQISNNGNFAQYYKAFEKQYANKLLIVKTPLPSEIKHVKDSRGLEDEIILSLYAQFGTENYFTTTEIAKLINQFFYLEKKGKSKNNVSRYFNQYFHPYYEIKLIDGKRKYRLSQTGVGHAKWLLRTRM
jgi:inosine/xanthosine triphosphate pyrophosphatase family protein/adenylate kinase family enzyme